MQIAIEGNSMPSAVRIMFPRPKIIPEIVVFPGGT